MALGLLRATVLACSRVVLLIAPLAALGGCAAPESRDAPKEFLDENTAATITEVERPLGFARDRPEHAGDARDYVTLAATAVNRRGHMDYVLVGYRWSTVDSRLSQERIPDVKSVVVAADDRRITFANPLDSPQDVGIATPIGRPPAPGYKPFVFATDLATLHALAAAQRLSLRIGTADSAPVYEVWEDGRPALAAWIRTLDGR